MAITAVIAVGLVGVAGGWADAATSEPRALEAGEVHEGAQFHVAVEGAMVAAELPDQYMTADPGMVFLLIDATMVNVWDRPVSTAARSGAGGTVLPRVRSL